MLTMKRTPVLLISVVVAACGAETADVDVAGAPEVTTPVVEKSALTYHTDIRPIVQKHCAGCHAAGQIGPFALNDYESVAAMADVALGAIDGGRMPPWMPDPDCHTFEDERLMPAEDVELLRQWIAEGKREGEPSLGQEEAPAQVAFEPTVTTRIRDPYLPDGNMPDDYRCFIMDVEFDQDSYVLAAQVVPDAGILVHHVLVYAFDPDMVDMVEQADAEEEGPGYTCFGAPFPGADGLVGGNAIQQLQQMGDGGVRFPSQIAGWVPGALPSRANPGEGKRILAGSKLVMQVHYNLLTNLPSPDQTEVQLVLTDEQPEYLTDTVPVAILDFEVEPGDPDAPQSRVFTNYKSEPMVIRAATPHMHLLGSAFNVEVLREDGSEECLVDIPQWDFNWQQQYNLPIGEYVVVQPGEQFRLTCTYDNSAANQPVINGEQVEPGKVGWGEGTLDEMCLLYFELVEPWAPPVVHGGAACAGTETCVAECGDDPSLDCVFSCEQSDMACNACNLQSLVSCAAPCIPKAMPMQACIQSCMMQTATLGGSFGKCMESECGDQYADILSCMDPLVADGKCESELTGCGVEF